MTSIIQLNDWVRYCNELNEVIFIVEGKRDNLTLRKLGILGWIVEKGGYTVGEIVDILFQHETIVILTDFDREGKRLRKIIEKEIQHRRGHGKIDNYARHFLYRFCKANGVNEIEDLDRFSPLD
ncbi:MAG: hypothetical protein ACXAC8_17360 [Candidatus Hodarchaeales archaeon]